tara:strand:+ start:381 stop:626 length:246 start_codon:yes stop_codon:yes gene_type:complete
MVIRTSKTGSSIGMSKLCEKCVIYIYNLPLMSGIKIKKIFYSNNDGTITKTTPTRLYNSKEQHLSSYSKNFGYRSILNKLS